MNHRITYNKYYHISKHEAEMLEKEDDRKMARAWESFKHWQKPFIEKDYGRKFRSYKQAVAYDERRRNYENN